MVEKVNAKLKFVLKTRQYTLDWNNTPKTQILGHILNRGDIIMLDNNKGYALKQQHRE